MTSLCDHNPAAAGKIKMTRTVQGSSAIIEFTVEEHNPLTSSLDAIANPDPSTYERAWKYMHDANPVAGSCSRTFTVAKTLKRVDVYYQEAGGTYHIWQDQGSNWMTTHIDPV